MRRTKFSESLGYKHRSTNSGQKTRPSYKKRKKQKMREPNSKHCRPGGSQSENKRKQKER